MRQIFRYVQVTLPFHMGGLGLRESQHSSHPAFLGSYNSAWILVSCLISLNPFQERSLPSLILKIYPFCYLIYPPKITYRFPWWLIFCQYFQLLNNSRPSSFTCCYSFFGYQQSVIEGHPSTISRLGLFSSWLYYCSSFMGKCFTFPIVTTLYLFVIDQFGDHLLCCSSGPLHIQHHDALVNIVCYKTTPVFSLSKVLLPVSSSGHLPSWLYSRSPYLLWPLC